MDVSGSGDIFSPSRIYIFSLRRRLNWPQALGLYGSMKQRGVKPSQKSLTAVASAMSGATWNVAMDAPSPCPWNHALSLASDAADLKLDRWQLFSFEIQYFPI